MPDVNVASSTSPGADDGDADDVLARLRANDDARRREAATRRLARESDRRGITADGDDPVVARARFDSSAGRSAVTQAPGHPCSIKNRRQRESAHRNALSSHGHPF